MSQTEVWTVGRLLQWTADYLKRHGADSPRLDAEILLAESRGCQRIELYTAFNQVPGEEALARFRELVRRRAAGTPVAYLVGRREFYSLSFRVTPDVLIPRPETEFLVVALLDRARQRPPQDRPVEVADVGTGSGILAICAARHLPECRVTAVDISHKALAVAAANAGDHNVWERIEWIESDLLAAVPADRRFDFIVSNPPYVAEGELGAMAPEVKDHEPRTALVAGPKGTEVIERLVGQAAERLVPGGWLLMEINPALEKAIQEILAAESRLTIGPTIKDLAGLPRVVQAQRKAE